MEVVTSLSQGRTAAAQCGLFTHKSVLVIFEPPCITLLSAFIIGCKTVFQLAVSANKVVLFFPSKFTDPLMSVRRRLTAAIEENT